VLGTKGNTSLFISTALSRSVHLIRQLQGKIDHPVFPRPIISHIELQMPFLHMDADTTKLEER
jgi:hypothetical protein